MNLNKIKKGVSLLKSPRKFLSEERERYLLQVMNNNFLIPIEKTLDDDIFIVGYPKSGNTWMQSLVSGMLYGIDTEFLPDRLAQAIVPDVHARQFYTRFGKINFFKSHHLPRPEYKKVIYLIRDGRDVITSYYSYNKVLGYDFSLEEMVKEGKGLFPSKWKDHVSAWMENPYNALVLIVRYEDLINQTMTELQKICEFASIERETKKLEKVIIGNSIDKMREKAKKYNGMGHLNWEGNKAQKFFRKGKVGSYKTELPKELIEYFNNDSYKELKEFNYEI